MQSDRQWLAWARARDRIPDKRPSSTAPAPKPPLSLRPRRLSVTQIEQWIANPYAIFARHILKLDPLPPLGASPDQSLRGALVHDVLSRFAKAFPNAMPADPLGELEKIAGAALEAYASHPRVAAFWLPRLKRFLTWFGETESERREGILSVIPETTGKLVLGSGDMAFTLTARADRIDDKGSTIVITDYKTGSVPNDTAVTQGRAPQLPLEAAIALSDIGFPNLSGRSVEGVRYIQASGGEPPGKELPVKSADVAALARSTLDGLAKLVAAFDHESTPYQALRRPGYKYDYDDYAHLARVAEWSAHVDEEVAP